MYGRAGSAAESKEGDPGTTGVHHQRLHERSPCGPTHCRADKGTTTDDESDCGHIEDDDHASSSSCHGSDDEGQRCSRSDKFGPRLEMSSRNTFSPSPHSSSSTTAAHTSVVTKSPRPNNSSQRYTGGVTGSKNTGMSSKEISDDIRVIGSSRFAGLSSCGAAGTSGKHSAAAHVSGGGGTKAAHGAANASGATTGRTNGFKSESDAVFTIERTSSFHDTLAGFRKMDKARGGTNTEMLSRLKSGKVAAATPAAVAVGGSINSYQDVPRPLSKTLSSSSTSTTSSLSGVGPNRRAAGGGTQSPLTAAGGEQTAKPNADYNYLNSQVEQLRQECDALKLDNRQLKASKYKTDTLKKTLISTEEENSRLSRDVARLNARINTIQKDAQKEVQSLRNQLQALQHNEKAMRLRIKNFNNAERDAMELHDEGVEDELNALRSANDQFSDELEEMRLCLTAARDEIRRRRAEADRYEVEKELELSRRRNGDEPSPPSSPRSDLTSSVLLKKELVELRANYADSSAALGTLRDEHAAALRDERDASQELRVEVAALSRALSSAQAEAAESKTALAELVISQRHNVKQQPPLAMPATTTTATQTESSRSSSSTSAGVQCSILGRDEDTRRREVMAKRREDALTEMSYSLFNTCKRVIDLQANFKRLHDECASTTTTTTTAAGRCSGDDSTVVTEVDQQQQRCGGGPCADGVDNVTKSSAKLLECVLNMTIDTEISEALSSDRYSAARSDDGSRGSPCGNTSSGSDTSKALDGHCTATEHANASSSRRGMVVILNEVVDLLEDECTSCIAQLEARLAGDARLRQSGDSLLTATQDECTALRRKQSDLVSEVALLQTAAKQQQQQTQDLKEKLGMTEKQRDTALQLVGRYKASLREVRNALKFDTSRTGGILGSALGSAPSSGTNGAPLNSGMSATAVDDGRLITPTTSPVLAPSPRVFLSPVASCDGE